jgi:hypothetical protein
MELLPVILFCVERAVRLGDAPTVNALNRGAGPQGRAEVRFLTFPPRIVRSSVGFFLR